MARLTRSVMAGLVLLTGAGCGLITGNDDEESELRRAELRWSRSGVQDYQVVVQKLCFCGYTRPQRITVRFGNVVSNVDAETGQPVVVLANLMPDVPGLFRLIREAREQNAHRLDVTYDSAYGFPTFIDIDYIKNAVDDELQVRASQFQPMR